MNAILQDLLSHGFVITDTLLEKRIPERLLAQLTELNAFDYGQPQPDDLLQASPEVDRVANDEQLLKFLNHATGVRNFPVKAFILDKSRGSNWEIPWHQDLLIAVSRQTDCPGYTNWSVEAGIPHVRPPVSVLEKLITLRIHLDDCGASNGAIHAIEGSHTLGVLDQEQIEALKARSTPRICRAGKNSVMLMKPLLLHYSPASASDVPRRILQIEYGHELGNGITWHSAG